MKKIIISTLILTTVLFLGTEILAQEDDEVRRSQILTESYLNINSPTELNDTLRANEGIEASSIDFSEDYQAEISAQGITGDRSYTLPNLSGEICLSAGNCDFAHTGTTNRLVKFGDEGFIDSSIEDNYTDVAINIDETGRLESIDDICTSLDGGICLTDLDSAISETIDPEELMEGTVQKEPGAGEEGRVPLWEGDDRLGDSDIYQNVSGIGIGTSPSHTLDVGGSMRVLGFRMPVSPEEGYGLMSDDRGVGTWRPVLTPRSEDADVAEKYPCTDCPQPGELVSVIDDMEVGRSKTDYDKNLIGIVSTDPALTLASYLDQDSSATVALAGRVPTKVSNEGGAIQPGDKLTSSSKPGVAMRANKTGRVVGVALESFSEDKGEIEVMINPHQYVNENSIQITDAETDEKYCLQIKEGELVKELCE